MYSRQVSGSPAESLAAALRSKADAVRRGVWGRATIDRSRHLSRGTCKKHRASTDIFSTQQVHDAMVAKLEEEAWQKRQQVRNTPSWPRSWANFSPL